MTTGDRMKARRKELKLSAEDVAAALNVSRATIFRYEKGDIEKLPGTALEPLAKVLQISPAIIVGVQDEFEYSSSGIDFTRVPLYEDVCCGNGGFVDENIIDMIPVPSKGLNPRAEYFAQYAKGESMKDAGINDGDLLIFERTDKIDDGVIGCFCNEDNVATCKKYKELNGIVMLQPMNIEFEPIIIDPLKDNFRCLGRLKKVIKDFDWED